MVEATSGSDAGGHLQVGGGFLAGTLQPCFPLGDVAGCLRRRSSSHLFLASPRPGVRSVRVSPRDQRLPRSGESEAGAAAAELHRVPAVLHRPDPALQPLLLHHQGAGQRDPPLQAQARRVPALHGGQVCVLWHSQEHRGERACLRQLGVHHRHRGPLFQREALARQGAAEGLHSGGRGGHHAGTGAGRLQGRLQCPAVLYGGNLSRVHVGHRDLHLGGDGGHAQQAR